MDDALVVRLSTDLYNNIRILQSEITFIELFKNMSANVWFKLIPLIAYNEILVLLVDLGLCGSLGP
jgi:hypothetical protein